MANFHFLNLNEDTRKLMLNEVYLDIDNSKLYISDRLNSLGKASYKNFLIKSISEGTEVTLEELLDVKIYFNTTYLRQGKPVKMPSNAAKLLAQSEFNRYYIRAICLSALNNNKNQVQIYRARESSWARPESEEKIGNLLSANALLEDLRNSIGIEPSLFPEINSGLSVKL